ncbi:MAG: hypothetical protein EBY71_04410, partial [Actinobacteria bacterium]|nr:hypothetical protein [Actinomycetota bacterium]
MSLLVREAKLDDIPIIYKYIKDLAEYEKAPEEAILTEDDLKRSFFPDKPQVYCLVSELENTVITIFSVDGKQLYQMKHLALKHGCVVRFREGRFEARKNGTWTPVADSPQPANTAPKKASRF